MSDNRFYGYDLLDAESKLKDAVSATNELLRVVCGDKAKHLSESVENNLLHAAYDLIYAANKELERRQFKMDFTYYICHECKSLAEARRYLTRELAATQENAKRKPNVEFDQWKKRIDERARMYGED